MRPNKKARLAIIDFLKNRDGSFCYICGIFLQDKDITIDHYFPLSYALVWHKDNLRICCFPCNNKKASILPTEQLSIKTIDVKLLKRVKRNINNCKHDGTTTCWLCICAIEGEYLYGNV